jgi:WD40 repeat protein
MASTDHTVRVFISSTFRDMHAERDHLVTVVFPELHERIERLGLEFFDVDLRWGVPAKDANGETANSWEYCRQWIDRVEPFFVCILGQRYGWEPEPEQLKDSDDRQRQQAQRRSITDMEVRHAVLSDRRKRRSYFYLRADEAPASASEFVDSPPLLDKLKQLKKEICSCGRPVRPYPCRWTGEGFAEMERFGRLVLDDLWSGVLRDRRYVSKEVWRQALGADPDTDPLYTDESQPVPRELWEKIVELAKPEPKEPLDAEREQMDAFAAARLRWFQGRTHELGQLTSFLNDPATDTPRLAFVPAVPGQGKSALLAKLHEQLKPSRHFVITHFVGATERSASAYSLVERLLGELDRSGIAWSAEQQEGQEPKKDFNSLCLRLAQRLGDYAGERRIVILLDALNQLSDGHDLQWLPTRLGPSVRVIVSCVEDSAAKADSPEQRVLQALGSRRPNPLRVKLGTLTPEDVHTIVVSYLDEYCKVLDIGQVDAICALPQARNPLYLLVMLGELRTLGGNDMNRIVGELIASMPQDHPDTVSLFRWVLQRLEVFGHEAVQWWCLYLAHGRVGMSSHELADLLARKLGPDAAATALLIERGLRRYLQRRGTQLDFFHGQLRQAVFDQYGPQAEPTIVHSDIATYFETRWREPDSHALSELPHHQLNADMWDALEKTLTDLEFIEAKCISAMPYDLVQDFQAAFAAPNQQASPTLHEFGRFVLKSAHLLSQDPKQTCQQAMNEPDQTAPARAAQSALENNIERRSFFLWMNKPQQTDPCLMTLTGHSMGVIGCAYSKDGQRIVSASHDNSLKVWDAETGECIRTLEGHSSTVTCCAYSEDNRRIVSSSWDKTLRLWDAETGECVRTMKGHTGFVDAFAYSRDGRRIVSASRDDTLRVWDVESGECIRVLEGHAYSVTACAFSPDGQRIVSGDSDRTLCVWDAGTGVRLYTLKGHSYEVKGCVYSRDGRTILSASGDGTLRIWDAETGACLRTFDLHSALSASDGQEIASAASETQRCWWDSENGVDVLRTYDTRAAFYDWAYSPDGQRIVSASWDHTLRVWDVEEGTCVGRLEGHSDAVRGCAYSPDGRRVVSASSDKTLRVWDAEACAFVQASKSHSGAVKACTFSPDGQKIVSAADDMTLCVWDEETGAALWTAAGYSGDGNTCTFSPDGRRIASVSRDNNDLQVWDVETGACVHTLAGHSGKGRACAYSPDGQRIVSAARDDDTLRVWDAETGACVQTLAGHTRGGRACAFSPDGRWIVSAAWNDTLRVWDAVSGLQVWDVVTGASQNAPKGHLPSVSACAYSPDGQRIASVADWPDNKLRVWDAGTGACVLALDGYPGSDKACAFSPDGRKIVSAWGSMAWDDNPLQVFDTATGACVQTLKGHSAGVRACAFSPDGRRIVSASDDKTLRVWELETGACVLKHIADEEVVRLDVGCGGRSIVAGGKRGTVFILRVLNPDLTSPLITFTRLYRFESGRYDPNVSANCKWCGQRFSASAAMLDTIAAIMRNAHLGQNDSPCFSLPAEAWAEPRLLDACPLCHEPLKFNPFIVDNKPRYSWRFWR